MKKALVTGASEGIGRAFASMLAKDGYTVTAVARNEARLQELMAELGAGHDYRVVDLADAAAVDGLAQALAGGGYDLLVNNAGVGLYGDFHQVELAPLRRMVQVNCDAVMVLAHAYLSRAKAGDALINVASSLAFSGMPTSAVYAATKAFVLSWSESLWYEQQPRGVYVMALCPGATETKLHTSSGGKETNKPPKSVTQTPEEVVSEALAALKARQRPTVITGSKNRMMIAMASRVMSRKQAVSMFGGFTKQLRT
jgi:hypothetical protein